MTPRQLFAHMQLHKLFIIGAILHSIQTVIERFFFIIIMILYLIEIYIFQVTLHLADKVTEHDAINLLQNNCTLITDSCN